MNDRVPPRLLFGAAYYHEYQPYERLATDLDLMAEAGFSIVRVGESVWSTWEPEEGVFDLDWLRPVLDEAHARQISVVIGTPTYAVPPWLRYRYPETTADRATGTPIPYGGRQDVDFTHPAFLRLAERLIRKIVDRYAGHPAVIGWQVDNEPGNELLHNRAVFTRFVEHLARRYGDVAALNERWGLTYWSHRIADWSELWSPDGNTTPSYDLAWRQYQARLTTEFIDWQARIVRALAESDQFVTTCLALGRPAVDPIALATSLDITTTNLYYPMQDGVRLPDGDRQLGRPEWLPWSGTWWLYLLCDTSWGVRQAPFLVTETGAGSIGESHVNFPAYDGQWRLAAWAMVARGAVMVEYWHWHSLHFGHETYWGGVLGHSLEPGRCYAELSRIGAEFAHADVSLSDLVPDAEVAVLTSPESRWAMQFQPPLAVEGTNAPDRNSYDRILAAWYRGLFAAGLQSAIVAPDQLTGAPADLAARWPVLIVPALYVASDDLLQRLGAYAHAGGHLVLTFRTGYADEEARPRPQVMPGPLREAAGLRYLEYTNLTEPVAVSSAQPAAFDVHNGHATAWADGLEANAATVLARYDHPHLGRWGAVTNNAHGLGQVTYVGTLPDQNLVAAIAGWVAQRSLPKDLWRTQPPTVTSTGASAAGGRLRFLSNWAWEPVSVPTPVPVTDLLTGELFETGAELTLEAWDVRVLVERGTAPRGNGRRNEEVQIDEQS